VLFETTPAALRNSGNYSTEEVSCRQRLGVRQPEENKWGWRKSVFAGEVKAPR
jgi:hypothetical protein